MIGEDLLLLGIGTTNEKEKNKKSKKVRVSGIYQRKANKDNT